MFLNWMLCYHKLALFHRWRNVFIFDTRNGNLWSAIADWLGRLGNDQYLSSWDTFSSSQEENVKSSPWHTCHFDRVLHGLCGAEGALGGSEGADRLTLRQQRDQSCRLASQNSAGLCCPEPLPCSHSATPPSREDLLLLSSCSHSYSRCHKTTSHKKWPKVVD